MASTTILSSVILFIFIFSFPTTNSLTKPSFQPKALLLPITKDKTTLQYTTIITHRTPLVSSLVVFDLGGQFLWLNCEHYVSTSYTSPRCNSPVCKLAETRGCAQCYSPKTPGCNNNTCSTIYDNTITGVASSAEIGLDVVSIQTTNGTNPGPVVKINNLIFACPNEILILLKGLAKGTVGMAGFGRREIGLPSLFADRFSLNKKFAICLSSGKGVAFFGNTNYVFLPGVKISILATTSLLINPVSTASNFMYGEKSSEYFIGLSDIKIVDKPVQFNKTLFKIDNFTGYGGTKISTVNPYTVLIKPIYHAFITAFIREAAGRNITRVKSVKPFGACFSTKNVATTRLGYAVPEIALVLHGTDVVWRIYGANSMVSINEDVMCLGFVNGGAKARTSVVIGGYQLEDHLIEFDLARNTVGFSSTLLGSRTNCANFNFSSTTA